MNHMKVFLVTTLLIGFAGIIIGAVSCSTGEKVTGSTSSASLQPFSMVVNIEGKELTVDTPRINSAAVITVAVKNSGHTQIDVAEIEVSYWDQFEDDEVVSGQLLVKNLAPGDVQTVICNFTLPHMSETFGIKGSLQIKVINIK